MIRSPNTRSGSNVSWPEHSTESRSEAQMTKNDSWRRPEFRKCTNGSRTDDDRQGLWPRVGQRPDTSKSSPYMEATCTKLVSRRKCCLITSSRRKNTGCCCAELLYQVDLYCAIYLAWADGGTGAGGRGKGVKIKIARSANICNKIWG